MEVPDSNVAELLEEGAVVIAQSLFEKGQHLVALSYLARAKTPNALFAKAMMLHVLASMETEGKPLDEITVDTLEKQGDFLDQSKHTLFLTMESIAREQTNPLHEIIQTLLEEIEAEQASILEQISALEANNNPDISNLSSVRHSSFIVESTSSSRHKRPLHGYKWLFTEVMQRENRTLSQSQHPEQLCPVPSRCYLAALKLSHSHLLEQNQRLIKREDKIIESHAELKKSYAELMEQVLQLTKDLQEIKLQQAEAHNQAPTALAPSIPARATPANQGVTGWTPSPAPQATSSPQLPQQPPQQPQHPLASRQSSPSPSAATRPTPAAPTQVPNRGFVSTPERGIVTTPVVATSGLSPFPGTPTKPLGTGGEPSKASLQPLGIANQNMTDRQRLTMMAAAAATGGGSPFPALLHTSAPPRPKTQFTGFSPSPASATSKPSPAFGSFSFSPSTVKPAPYIAQPATTSSSASSFTSFSFGMSTTTSAPSTSTLSTAGIFKPAGPSKATLQPAAAAARSPVVFGKPNPSKEARSMSPVYPGFFASPKGFAGFPQADQMVPSSRKLGQSPLVKEAASPKVVASGMPSKSHGVSWPIFPPGSPSPSAAARPTPAAPAQVPNRGFVSTPERGVKNVTTPVTTPGLSSFAGTPTKPLGAAGEPSKVSLQPQKTTDRQRLAKMAATAVNGGGSPASLLPTSAAAQPNIRCTGFTPCLASATSKPSPAVGSFSFFPSTVKPAPSSAKPATTSSSASLFTSFSFGMSTTTSAPSTSTTLLTAGVFKPAGPSKATLQPAAAQPKIRFTGFTPSPASTASKPSPAFGSFSFSPSTVKPAPYIAQPATTSSFASPLTGFSFGMSTTTSPPSTSTLSTAGVFKPAGPSKATLQPAAAAGGSPVFFGKPNPSQKVARSASPVYPGFFSSPKGFAGTPPQYDQTVPSSRKLGQSPLVKEAASPKVADTPKSVSFKSEGEDDDVIFVSMAQPTPGQRARAEKLKLPDGFYLYENAPPCKGCIGCIEDLDLDSLFQKGGEGQASSTAVRPKEPTSSAFGATGGSLHISSPGGSMFGGGDVEGGMSFATLAAHQTDGFEQPFGKKASDKPFAFAHTGAPVFGGGGVSHGNHVNDDSYGGGEGYDPYYEPIVSLPDIGSISTGEEDEEEMFRHRAKLYHYDRDNKAWKERGVGDIKVLRNPKTGNARILMRRDQILKLCANHWITADMVLKPMMASETAWIWFAVDFSEEEAKAEQLAVKFKHLEDAKRFKECFLEAQELLGDMEEREEEDEEEEVVSKSSASLAARLANKPGSWDCDACYSNNAAESPACVACTAPKPGAKAAPSSGAKGAGAPSTGSTLAAKFANKPGTWDCDACYSNNASESSACVACTAPKPGAKAVSSFSANGAGAPSTGSTLAAKFANKPGSWDCNACYTNNAAESSACVACTAPKPGTDPKPSTSTCPSTGAVGGAFASPSGLTFGSKPSGASTGLGFKSSPTAGSTTGSGVAFKVTAGFSLSSQSTPSTGFVFDAKKYDTQKPKENDGAIKAPSTGFTFDAADSNEAAPSTSTGATTPGGTLVTDEFTFDSKSAGPVVRSCDPNLSSVLAEAINASSEPNAATSTIQSIGGEVNPEEEHDIHFQPIVKLPDNVDIVTGEEQEVAVFVGHGKLYRFDGGARQWKERGVGDMKIMKEEETDVYRIVMRRDQIHKVCANHYITSSMALHPMAGSDRAWVWHAMDAADGEPTSEQLAIKFKDPSIAASFKEMFEEAQTKIRLQEAAGKDGETGGQEEGGAASSSSFTSHAGDGVTKATPSSKDQLELKKENEEEGEEEEEEEEEEEDEEEYDD